MVPQTPGAEGTNHDDGDDDDDDDDDDGDGNGDGDDDNNGDSASEHPDGEEIVDDAFFQRYHFPEPANYAHEDGSESSENTEGPLSPTRARLDAASGQRCSSLSTCVSPALSCLA